MRTERVLAVVGLALAASARPARADDQGPWVAVLDAEASVIGESFGPRAEVLWRPGAPGTVSHLRAALGVLPGPELTFVPVSLGYRALWRAAHVVQPFAGAGWENQHFVISGSPTTHRWLAIYAEGGCGFEVRPHLSLGVALSIDVAFLRDVGPGLQVRSFAAWRF